MKKWTRIFRKFLRKNPQSLEALRIGGYCKYFVNEFPIKVYFAMFSPAQKISKKLLKNPLTYLHSMCYYRIKQGARRSATPPERG
jgi:hypothetical protein